MKTSRLALIFAILILSSTLASAGFKSADIDNDGFIGFNDIGIVNYFKNSGQYDASADVNNDGAIDNIDIDLVINLQGTTIGNLSRVSDASINRRYAAPGQPVIVTIKVFDFDNSDALPLEGTTVTLSGKEIQPIEMDYIGVQNNKDQGFYQASFKMPNADPVSVQIIVRKGPSFIQTLPTEAVRLLFCLDPDGEKINEVGTAKGSNDAFSDFASISDSCQGEILKNTADNNGGFRPLVAEAVCLSDRRASTKTIQCLSDQGCINGACQRLPDDDGDGFLDPQDACPDQYGKRADGCPECIKYGDKASCDSRTYCEPTAKIVQRFAGCTKSYTTCEGKEESDCKLAFPWCKSNYETKYGCIGVRIFGVCVGIPTTSQEYKSCLNAFACSGRGEQQCRKPVIRAKFFRSTVAWPGCGLTYTYEQVFDGCVEKGQANLIGLRTYSPDSDGDGIFDTKDNCPKDGDRPVDNFGCPISNPCTSLTKEACGQRADCKIETTEEETCPKIFKFLFWCIRPSKNTVDYCAGTQCALPRDQCIQELSCTLRNIDSNECVTSKTNLAEKVVGTCAGKTTDLACVKGDNMDYVVACDTKQVREIGPKGSCEKDKSIVGVQVKIENGQPTENSITSLFESESFQDAVILSIDNRDGVQHATTNKVTDIDFIDPNSIENIRISKDITKDITKELGNIRTIELGVTSMSNLRGMSKEDQNFLDDSLGIKDKGKSEKKGREEWEKYSKEEKEKYDKNKKSGIIGGGQCGQGCHMSILDNARLLTPEFLQAYGASLEPLPGEIRGASLEPLPGEIRDAAFFDRALSASAARRAPGRGGTYQDPIQVISID